MVSYPVARDNHGFEVRIENFQHDVTLVLAAPLAAHAYQTWWWSGFAGGAAALFVSILIRLAGAEALRKTAGPAEVLDPQPDA